MQNTIKIERAKIDFTQEQLAKVVGVSRQTIHSIERNKYIPSAVLALKITNYFKKPFEEIFTLEESD